MIDRIAVRGFKNLWNVTVDLGRLNLFVGANASGKSNFFEALRVLQGIGRGLAVGEIMDGQADTAAGERWQGVRGGSAKACFEGPERSETLSIAAAGKLSAGEATRRWEYSVSLSPRLGRVTGESLRFGGHAVFTAVVVHDAGVGNRLVEVEYQRGGHLPPLPLPFDRSRSVLSQFKASDRVESRHRRYAARVADALADVQRVAPAPAVLRSYSQTRQVNRMGEHGENFAALVRAICADPDGKAAYLDWLRQSLPEEVDGVGTLSGAMGEPLFMLRERGREFPAPVLGDGTLRFAMIAAAFFQPAMPGTMVIEEIERGIHPSRTRLILELLRANAATGSTQILATTHSPAVLAWLELSEYASTYVCRRDEATGEATIRKLGDTPGFGRAAGTRSLPEMFTEGWLEAAL